MSDQLRASYPPRSDGFIASRPSIPSISYLNSALDPQVGLPGIASLTAQSEPDLQDGGHLRQFPLQDVQEACLLRYFIDEISQWVSLS